METQTFKIEGLKEVMDALKELPTQIQAKLLQGIARKVERKYLVSELKTAIPYKRPIYQQSVRVVNDPNDKTASFVGFTTNAFVLRFLEYGTKQRQTKKGFNRGAIASVERVNPAIDKQIVPIIEFYNKELGNEIEKSLKRRIKRIFK